MRDDTQRWIEADKQHVWHPFTPQGAWTDPAHEPLVIVRGEGAWLWDSEGRRYLDGNSSIWTNIHGHSHPEINRAITEQLKEIAHSSYLGFANPRASELAAKLVALFPPRTLERVFFSDDGSTAIEVAMKMSLQFQMQTSADQRTRFVAFVDGYHGDTMGAAALGGVSRFFERFRRFGPDVDFVRGLQDLEGLDGASINALVIEPLIQGVNEMRPWPVGMLAKLRSWCDRNGVLLILDEVMTGFGRTGTMFACEQEHVVPDFLCLAKGLSGGYLPLAATLTTDRIYQAFLGGADKAFYYGHSFTANPTACAAALANLALFESEQTLEKLHPKIELLARLLGDLGQHRAVKDVRQCGFVAGIELTEGLADPVCQQARHHGLLTRPIRETLVLMLPLCTSLDQVEFAVRVIGRSLHEVVGGEQPGSRTSR